jgi:hypothetical protein
MTDGRYRKTHCMASTLARFESSGFLHLNTLVYAAPVDNEEKFSHPIADACQIIRNCPGIFERMLRSMMRRVEVYIEFHEGHF